MSIAPDRLAEIERIVLDAGAHEPDGQFCVMEAVAYVAGEPWSDDPECASPVLGAFLRNWNDKLDDATRQRLKPYIPRLVGTRGTAKQEEKRAWMATDWLTRECAPAFLRLAGLTEHAETLEGLAALTTTKRAEKAQPALDAAWDAAWDAAGAATGVAARVAAEDATWDAAGNAAWDAAGVAAGVAAGDAARAAAGAAARVAAEAAAGAAAEAAAEAAAGDATWDATWAAARVAAGAKLAPTVSQLQESAFLLLDRMIAVKPGGFR